MKKFLSLLVCCLAVAIFVGCGPDGPLKIAVTGITLDRNKVDMTEGETLTLVPTLTPSDATDKTVRWTTSNLEVATVSDGGLVSALKAGSAVITATTNDGGLTASCTVTVDIALAAITGEASHISCRNAVIAGKVCLPNATSADLTFGVLYSTNSGVLLNSASKIEAKSFDADFNFTIDTEVLEPETTYYYRSYILQNNEVTYGETKSFTTLAVSSMIQTLDATEVDAGVATLNAMLNLTDCKYETLEYGFKLTPVGESEATLKVDNLAEKAFFLKCESLVREKQYDVVAYVTLDGRTYVAEKKSFTTQSIKASVALNPESNITEFKATVSGILNLESQGQFSKSAKLYYRDSNGTTEDLKASGTATDLALDSDGSFSYTLQSLLSGKTYYYVVAAYVDGVEFISEVRHFKTASIGVNVVAEDATEVTELKGMMHGRLTVTSIESVSQEVWFCYSTTAKTIEALKTQGTKVEVSLTNGTFVKRLTGLTDNTTYYYIACAKVNGKEYYSEVNSFTTAEIKVTLSATDATDITEFKGRINGSLVVTSTETVEKQVWFLFSDSAQTVTDLKSQGTNLPATPSNDGTFSKIRTGLAENTTYYYMACARVNGKEFFSEVKSFHTAAIRVNLMAATEITELKATLNGALTIIEDVSKELWFCYSATSRTAETLKSQGTKVPSVLGNNGAFSKKMTGLTENTTYYYIACAKVNGKDYVSEVKSFKTADFTADVMTNEVTYVKYSTASLYGTLSVVSIETLTNEVWFLYSETATTIDALKAEGTKVSSTLSGDVFTADIAGLKDGTCYRFVACGKVHNRVLYGTMMSFNTYSYPEPASVDMGLSVKWGSFNVGSSKPEEYGEHYSWGETTTKSYYDWSTYTLCGGSSRTITKYCTNSSYCTYGTVDNKTSLEKVDDVAAQKLGGNWRIPSDEEWTELRNTDNCTWTWTTENSVNGYRVTSKKTGNSIFLPASGYGYGVGPSYAGSCGVYCSSSLITDFPSNAWVVEFLSSVVARSGNFSRYIGLSVRPVTD